MNTLHSEHIISFLKENIEPLDNSPYGAGYRASVYLTDGTYLPCVVFRNPGIYVALALHRFKEEKGSFFNKPKSAFGYDKIVKHFVTSGNRINYYNIAKVEASPYALPLNIQKQLRGETTMGWTGFALQMADGKYFGFGTNFHVDFFDMPQGYLPLDIANVFNHSYVTKTGVLKDHQVGFFDYPEDYYRELIYREKPFFECYIDGL